MLGEIVPFKVEHLHQVVPREQWELDGIEGWSVNGTLEHALALASSGPAFSYLSSQGEILGVSGATILWPGVGWGWAYIDERASDEGLGLVHAFRRGIDNLWKVANLHRLQANVRADYGRGMRLMRLLDMVDETRLLQKFGRDGSDHILFARVAK